MTRPGCFGKYRSHQSDAEYDCCMCTEEDHCLQTFRVKELELEQGRILAESRLELDRLRTQIAEMHVTLERFRRTKDDDEVMAGALRLNNRELMLQNKQLKEELRKCQS